MARASRLFDLALAVLAGALTIVLLGVVTGGIVSRGLNAPFIWTDEISGYLMVWLACTGWMIATRKSTHIRIQIFQEKLPGLANQGLELAIQIAMIVFGLVVAYGSVHLIRVNSDVEAVTLPVPTALLYVPLLPAGLLTALQGAMDLLRLLRPSMARVS